MTSTGIPFETDSFYILTGANGAQVPILKSGVHEWLDNISLEPGQHIWIPALVEKSILACLSVQVEDRADAVSLHAHLRIAVRTYSSKGHHTADHPPERTPRAAPSQEPTRFSDNTHSLRPSPRGTNAPSVSSRTSLQLATNALDRGTPSTGSQDTSRSVASQEVIAQLVPSYQSFFIPAGEKAMPTKVLVSKHANHILFCYATNAYLFTSLSDMDAASALSLKPQVIRECVQHVLPVGQYLAIFTKTPSQVRFQSLGSDPNGEILASLRRADFKHVWDTSISSSGDIIFMTPRHLQLVRITHEPPKKYMLPDRLRYERFRAIQFDRAGRNLWAIGTKHWFKFTVKVPPHDWLLGPQIGDIELVSFHPSLLMCPTDCCSQVIMRMSNRTCTHLQLETPLCGTIAKATLSSSTKLQLVW